MKLQIFVSLMVLLIFSGIVWAHGGEKHQENITDKPTIIFPPEQLALINQRYLKEIKPIMEKKCFFCHGVAQKLPWYASIPGPKQLIQWDMKEAKKHIDMSNDFPFKSHETPIKDLESIIELTQERDMPPLRFVIMHWDTRPTDRENKLIHDWASDSLKSLTPKP